MAKIFCVFQAIYPEEVRIGKIATTLLQAGHEFLLLARCPKDSRATAVASVKYVSSARTRKTIHIPYHPLWRTAILQVAEEFRPNLILARDMNVVGNCSIAARKLQIPLVLDMAENYPAVMKNWDKYQRNFFTRLAINNLKIADAVERDAVRKSDGIMIVCEAQRQRLLQQYGVDERHLAVVRNTPPSSELTQEHIGSNIPPTVFAYHGYFNVDRNIESLILGFGMLQQRYPNIRLLLAGVGGNESQLRHLSHNHAKPGTVEFSGEFILKELPALLGKTDIGCIPFPNNDFYNTTASNKLYDYFQYGKPVVVTPTGPHSHEVMESKAGIIAKDSTPEAIAAAMEQMLAATNLKEMSEAGLKYSRERANWEQDAEIMLKFLGQYL